MSAGVRSGDFHHPVRADCVVFVTAWMTLTNFVEFAVFRLMRRLTVRMQERV